MQFILQLITPVFSITLSFLEIILICCSRYIPYYYYDDQCLKLRNIVGDTVIHFFQNSLMNRK